MKIIEPSVELWQQDVDWKTHVANCARICYRSENKTNNEKLIDNLLVSKHLSMFRHRSVYWIIPIIKIQNTNIWTAITILMTNNVYVRHRADKNKYYIATNGQFYIENLDKLEILNEYIVDSLTFLNTEIGHKIARYTFKIVTQISTSRELNRVSPNNISEQSTRYVYEDGTLCRPHWLSKDASNVFDIKGDKLNASELRYLNTCENAFIEYKNLIDAGLNRQDARGVLPLDTATVCAYTYFIDEWMHIIDLRYYGTTGKPHPNAKIIAGRIRHCLLNEGYEFI